MLKFILKRIGVAIPTLLILITISFFMMRLAPGNPFSSDRALPPQVMKNLNAKYGLDKPIAVQYWNYLKNLSHGDLGPSFKYKDSSVTELVRAAFPVSAKIGVIAFILCLIIGISFGCLAALNQNSWIDYLLMSTAMIGVAIPNFVLGPLLVLIFAVSLHWLPAGGWNGGAPQYLVLPVIGMMMYYVASMARIMRGSLIEVLNSNFIRTAKAKGLSKTRIILKHALRPSLLPIASFMGPAFVGIITGSVVIETIFGLPGIGQIFVNGALNRDYGVVLGVTVLIGALTIAFNAIADILLAVIDPKIRM